MTRIGLGWVALVVLIIIGLIVLIVYAGAPGGTVIPSATSTAPVAVQPVTQTLPGGAVSFSYPPDTYGLATAPEQVLVHPTVPPCSTPFDYCVYRTGTEYASTTFESAGVAIRLRTDLATQRACLLTQPAGFTSLQSASSTSASYAASVFGPVDTAAAGHSSQGTLYRLWAAGGCTEWEARIGVTNADNYPPGTIEPFADEARAAVGTELASIINSVTVSGVPVAWPALPPHQAK